MTPKAPRLLLTVALLLAVALPLMGIDACGPGSCQSDQDGDGVCDNADACAGADDNLDADADGTPDACDACPTDATNDADADGVCDGAPVDLAPFAKNMAVLQRDADDRALVNVQGTVLEPGFDEVLVTVYRDGALWLDQGAPLQYTGTTAAFSVAVSLEAGLYHYTLRVDLRGSSGEQRVTTRSDVVVGDLVLIQGQSNAVAADYHSEGLANESQSPWIRSFGNAGQDPATVAADLEWGVADGIGYYAHASVGAWGLRMAALVMAQTGMPVGLLNGAVGGTYISQHQRNDANPEDLNTIYGRFLYRANRSEMAAGARIMVWYQGESDGSGWGSSSLAANYAPQFGALRSDWKADFPAMEKIYVFQVRYGCGLDHPSDAYLGLFYYDVNLAYLGAQLFEFWGGPSWTRYWFTGTTPPSTAYIAHGFYPIGAGADIFDDASANQGGPELLQNTSLETGSTFPDGWASYGTGSYTWLTGDAHSGQRSMRQENGSSTALVYQLLPSAPSQTYTLGIWAKGEFTGGWYDVREALRSLAATWPDVSLMSTNAAPGHDGCHFYYVGYKELGDRIGRLVNRDFFGGPADDGIGAPEVTGATLTSAQELRLHVKNTGGGMVVEPGATMYFRIDGAFVTGATVSGDDILLQLSDPTSATTLSYTDHALDLPDVVNGLGIGLLSFDDLPIVRP